MDKTNEGRPQGSPIEPTEKPAEGQPAEGLAPETVEPTPEEATPAPPKPPKPDDAQRIRDALYILIRKNKLTRRDLDRALDATRGTYSNVLDGKVELKFRHIEEVLSVVGVEMGEFFESVYGPSFVPFQGPIAPRALGLIEKSRRPIPEFLEIPEIPTDRAAIRRLVEEKIEETVSLVLKYQLSLPPLPVWKDEERKETEGEKQGEKAPEPTPSGS